MTISINYVDGQNANKEVTEGNIEGWTGKLSDAGFTGGVINGITDFLELEGRTWGEAAELFSVLDRDNDGDVDADDAVSIFDTNGDGEVTDADNQGDNSFLEHNPYLTFKSELNDKMTEIDADWEEQVRAKQYGDGGPYDPAELERE